MTPVKTWRRVTVIAIIVSLSITALVGIVALFSGSFGELQAKILLTTLLVAGFSVVALCDLTIAERPVRVVGFAGVAVSAVAFILGLVMIWGGWGDITFELVRWFFISGILALSFAQASLLLLLSDRAAAAVRIALWITLALVVIVAMMVVLPLATNGEFPGSEIGDGYWRFFGAAAILDAVGTIAVPVVALITRASSTPRPGSSVVTLPIDLAARLDAYAAAVGSDRNEIAAYAVTEHLGRHEASVRPPALPEAYQAPRSGWGG